MVRGGWEEAPLASGVVGPKVFGEAAEAEASELHLFGRWQLYPPMKSARISHAVRSISRERALHFARRMTLD